MERSLHNDHCVFTPNNRTNCTLNRLLSMYKCESIEELFKEVYSLVPVTRHVLLFGTVLLVSPVHIQKFELCLLIGPMLICEALLSTYKQTTPYFKRISSWSTDFGLLPWQMKQTVLALCQVSESACVTYAAKFS